MRLPYLLYLQGGPGFESPRPTEASGWISKACEEYRLILLDQAYHTILTFFCMLIFGNGSTFQIWYQYL